MSKFNILNKAESLVDYILTIAERSPKKIRLDIVPELRKKVLLIDEYIVRANSYAINGDNTTEESIYKTERYNVATIYFELCSEK